MANYYATARSNYVRLKPGALDALDLFDVDVVRQEHSGLHAVISTYDGGTPRLWLDDFDDESLAPLVLFISTFPDEDEEEIDLLNVLPQMIHPEDTLVWMEVGHEKARYLVGETFAYKDGRLVQYLSLDDIYKNIDPGVTRVEY